MTAGNLKEENLQIVTFRLGAEEFGLDIRKVQEITKFIEAVKVPRMREYVDGVVNLRGRIVPVIDLRKRLGKASAPNTEMTRIIIINTGDKIVGLVVDNVVDVFSLSKNKYEECPSIQDHERSDYIMGVARQDDRLITVLAVEHLINEQ